MVKRRKKDEIPNCIACGKKLRNAPRWEQHRSKYGRRGDGCFCSKSCGYAFGLLIADALQLGDMLPGYTPIPRSKNLAKSIEKRLKTMREGGLF